jgi:methionyl-tRNA formyltransferase
LRIAIIGRSEALFNSMQLLHERHEIVAVATARAAPEYAITAQDFLAWARERDIPAIGSAGGAELDALCASVPADLALSVNYPRIIPQNIIDRFPLGILNAHGGDLPRYRGNACQAWAIINGEDRIGLCVHRMIGGEVDAGDVLARAYLDLGDDTYVGDCLDWIERETPGLFLDALSALERDSGFVLERQSPEPQDALRCFPRRPEDGRIDWRLPAQDVQRLVRASSRPFAGAYGHLDGRIVRVWRADVVQHHLPFVASPGQVLSIRPGSIDVACGEARDVRSNVALRISDFSVDGHQGLLGTVFRSIRQRLD